MFHQQMLNNFLFQPTKKHQRHPKSISASKLDTEIKILQAKLHNLMSFVESLAREESAKKRFSPDRDLHRALSTPRLFPDK